MPECCIYTRISHDPKKDDEDEKGRGVARQEKDCRGLAKRLDWKVSEVYSDNDVSAYDGKVRPKFEEMLDAIKRGQFDGLICWHTDRLSRSMKDLERVIEVCDAADVPIRTVNGGDLDLSNATGKMMARILGSVARQESEHKGERQRRANIQRAEAGGWWSSHRVFGYTMKGEVIEAEAKMIRQAAADILAGCTLTAIARRWNDAGVTTTRGARWDVSRVKRLMVNPRYAALRTYKRKSDKVAKIVGPGDWEAILDHETHAGVSAILTNPSRGRSAVSWERRYLGSYRYRCGRCDGLMKHAISTHSDGSTYHRYTCIESAHLSRAQVDLDAYVESVALDMMRDAKALRKILTAANKKNGGDPAELRARRNALQAQKDELAALFTDGVLDGPAVRREAAKLSDRIGAVDAALAEMARRSPLADLLAEGVDKLDQRWSEASVDMKGKIIDEMFTVVVIPAPKGPRFNHEYVDFIPVTTKGR